MSGLFFVLAPPVTQEIAPEKGTLLKKGASQEAGDFSTFLETYLQNAGLFAVPPVFAPTRACGSFATSGERTALPCPLSSGSSVSLSCQGTATVEDPLERFSTLLSDALEMVENFTVTLRLGEGKVTVSGLRGDDGNFSFSIEGKKEALVEFFTLLFENLRAWFEESAKDKTQCGCGRISCGNADSAVVMEAENTPEAVLGGTSSSETNSVPEAEDTCTAPLPPSLGGVASTPEVVLGEASPLAEEVDSSASSAEVPASAESSTPSPEEQDTAPLLQRESERVAFPPEPKKDQAQNDTLSFEENTAQSLVLVRDAKGFSPQETTSVTVKDFAKVFEEVLKGVSEVKGRKEVVLRLEPEHLGSIVVRLEDQGGKIHCIWEVANPETRALLVKYLPILEAHLGAQGMFFEHFLGDGSNAYSFWGGFWSQVPGGNQDEEVPPEDFEVSQVNFLV